MISPVLVTGAQGYLGRYVVSYLLEGGEAVVGIGRSPRDDRHFSYRVESGQKSFAAPLPEELKMSPTCARYSYERCDLADPTATGAMLDRHRPQKIIHLAAALRDDPVPALLEANVTATINLCTAAAALRTKPTLILGSSGSVYGAQEKLPVSESARPDPIGFYAASKYMGEIAARAITQQWNMDLAIVRIFNLLGPGLQQRHLAGLVAHAIADMEIGVRPPVLALGNLSTVRDFVDVRDVARLLVSLPSVAAEILNAGSGNAVGSEFIVRGLLSEASIPIELVHQAHLSRPGADEMYADVSKLDVIFQPEYSLQDSLRDMLRYTRFASEFRSA